jgi:hypothetical protein
MSDTPSRTSRITTAVVAAAVAVVLGAAAFGVSRSGAPADAAAPSENPPVATASPVPQPTETAPLRSAAPISGSLTAAIVSMKAVEASATQPGQVGGPAVRFTVRLTNTGTSPIDLSSTVLNVYSGVDEEPAYQLDSDGVVFPASVPAGRSVTGSAVFTIPTADRAHVQVTVDTSTSAPVVAFSGAAPR